MTHKIAWLTDIHLDHLTEYAHDPAGGLTSMRQIISEEKVRDFCGQVVNAHPDSVVITGDISTAQAIEVHLMWLEQYLPGLPIYFVLGNHDYYGTQNRPGSIAEVRSRIAKYNGTKTQTCWLPVAGVVKLTEKTALIGHDGWYDGGYSDWFKSKLLMNEYFLTSEFRMMPQKLVYNKINELAQECADHIKTYSEMASKAGFQNLLVATHVPPFRNNSRAPDRSLSNHDWLPNMSSKRAGDALLEAARAYPAMQITCLSGHTHTAWEERYLPNLLCLTGQAEYGKPEWNVRIIEVE